MYIHIRKSMRKMHGTFYVAFFFCKKETAAETGKNKLKFGKIRNE